MERTRKYKEGRYLLITTKLQLHPAQQEDFVTEKILPRD